MSSLSQGNEGGKSPEVYENASLSDQQQPSRRSQTDRRSQTARRTALHFTSLQPERALTEVTVLVNDRREYPLLLPGCRMRQPL